MQVIIRSSTGVETVKTLTTHYTVSGAGTANAARGATNYGGDKAIFGYGGTGSDTAITNLVSNTFVGNFTGETTKARAHTDLKWENGKVVRFQVYYDPTFQAKEATAMSEMSK